MSDIFLALADSARRDLLVLLLDAQRDGTKELSVNDMVDLLSLPQPTVSKHLKVLREAEVVSVREEGQRRFYSLDSEPFHIVEDYVFQFALDGVETEFTMDFIDDDTQSSEILPDAARAAAQSVGRSAGKATQQVKQLVAKFKLR